MNDSGPRGQRVVGEDPSRICVPSTRRPDPAPFGCWKGVLVLGLMGAVVLAVRPDWKQIVGKRVQEIRSSLLPQFEELVRRTIDLPAAPPSTRPGSAGPATPSSTRDLLAEALAIPANEPWRRWAERPHELRLPTARMEIVPFREWTDPSACVDHWEGDRRVLRRGCTPPQLQVRCSVDSAAAEAIQRHYGIPSAAVWATSRSGSRAAIDRYIAESAKSHGVEVGDRGDRYVWRYDPTWLVRVSAPLVRDFSDAVVRVATGRRAAAVGDRELVEVLAGYVQAAVPYRKIDDERAGHYQGGLRTPLMTLLRGGDCDSKCLLLATLIRSQRPGIPIEIIGVRGGADSDRNDHAVLAVGIDPRDSEWKRNMTCGRRGVLIETTGAWGVGQGFTDQEFADLEPTLIP